MNLPDYTFVRMRVPKDPDTGDISCFHCPDCDDTRGAMCMQTLKPVFGWYFHHTAPDNCPFVIALRDDEREG